MYFILEIVLKFKEKYLNVDINFWEEIGFNKLDEFVINGDVDIVIFNYLENNFMLFFEFLKNEEIVLVVSKNYLLVNEGKKIEGCKFFWIDIKRFKDDNFIINYID